MRSERDIIDQIRDHASRDANVRAVLLHGSRVNPDALLDDFRDYDLFYLVSNVQQFVHEHTIRMNSVKQNCFFVPIRIIPSFSVVTMCGT